MINFLLTIDVSKNTNFNLKGASIDFSDIMGLVDSLIGLALFVALIVVVYHIVNNEKFGKGRIAVGSWLTALIIYYVLRGIA